MRAVPGWAVVTAILAPLFLLGGLVWAPTRQSVGYSSTRDTISSLAGLGAADRWIMVAGLAGLGLSYIATGIGLRPAALPGRIVMIFGGVACLLSAVFPQPRAGTSEMHGIVAGVGFIALAVWPAFAFHTHRLAPWSLRPLAALTATAVLLGLLFWFTVELFTRGDQIGLTERFLAGAESLWPVVVAVTARQLHPELAAAVAKP